MEHDLIKTGDPDSCHAIEDGHGEVVLAYCRRCKKGESELAEKCPMPERILEEIIESIERHNKQYPDHGIGCSCMDEHSRRLRFAMQQGWMMIKTTDQLRIILHRVLR